MARIEWLRSFSDVGTIETEKANERASCGDVETKRLEMDDSDGRHEKGTSDTCAGHCPAHSRSRRDEETPGRLREWDWDRTGTCSMPTRGYDVGQLL